MNSRQAINTVSPERGAAVDICVRRCLIALLLCSRAKRRFSEASLLSSDPAIVF